MIPAAGILAGIAAGGIWLRLHPGGGPPPEPAAPPVVPLPDEISLSGTLRAREVVPVAAPVEGLLEQFLVETGQEVFEGQLLARIRNGGLEQAHQVAAADVERLEARVRALESGFLNARLEASRARAEASRARAEFERAEKTFLRQQLLLNEGATPKLVFEKSRKEFDLARLESESLEELARQAENRVATLQKELETSRKLLEKHNQALEEAKQNLAAAEVHSPVNGIVLARNKQPGDPVGPEVQDLFQIAADLSVLEVEVEPDPPVLERLQPGQPALVDVVEGPPGGMLGQIKEIANDKVLVEFPNPSAAVKPGLAAQVRFKLR